MGCKDKERGRMSSAGFRSMNRLTISLVALGPVIPAHANVEARSSAAYQEVTVPLDPETKAVGGALYAQHCAASHDGNIVRTAALRVGKCLAQYVTRGND